MSDITLPPQQPVSARRRPGETCGPRRRDYSLVLVAGAALPLAFAPYDWWPLGLLPLAVLFCLWRSGSPRRAMLLGWLFGLGSFGVGVSWISISMVRYGNTSLPVAALLTGALVAFLALYPAAAGYLLRRVFAERRPAAWTLLGTMPALWTLLEWLRGWVLTGFPWLDLGASQTDTPLGALGPLAGPYAVSWATALGAALVVALWAWRGRARLRAAAALLLLWTLSAALGQVQWTRPAGRPIQVALVQGNIPQERKWLPEQREPTLELYRRLSRQHWDVDLIVWPEAAIPAFFRQVLNDFLVPLHREARTNHTDMLVGVPVLDWDGGRYYNAMLALRDEPQFYFKHHLVPFGDYVPLEDHLRGLLSFFDLPMSSFSAGPERQPPLAVAGHRAAVSICYEIAFASEVARAVPAADLLVNVSNDTWFGDSIGPHQHLQLARARARETGRPLLRATNNGITAIIDAYGKLQAVAPHFEQAVLTGRIQPTQGLTPFVRWGQPPVLLGLLLTLLVSASPGRRRR